MIHNEKCDNCLCRTVCHFTFPGYELTEEDGECGHFISKTDIINSAIKQFTKDLKEHYFYDLEREGIFEEDIDNFTNSLTRKE